MSTALALALSWLAAKAPGKPHQLALLNGRSKSVSSVDGLKTKKVSRIGREPNELSKYKVAMHEEFASVSETLWNNFGTWMN